MPDQPRRLIADEAEPAAEARSSSGPVTWRELRDDFFKLSRGQLTMAVILLLCGLGFVMQIRARSEEADYTNLRRADLVQMLDDLNAESRRLEAEIATLEQTRIQLQTGADRQEVARVEAQRRLDVLSILGGTAPAQGTGVRITISDPQAKVTPEILLNAVEELRDAGAEVIEINNAIRVIASSWVGSGPNGLVVDDQTVARPIVLEVIGDSHALSEAARFRGGLVSEVQDDRVGGQVTIVSDQQIVVSSVVVPKANRFARPA